VVEPDGEAGAAVRRLEIPSCSCVRADQVGGAPTEVGVGNHPVSYELGTTAEFQ
jgi:hypothetical protein